MTAAMDSPDHSPIMPSSDIQGSPFFHFLCSLSPIKQVRLGHGAQGFSELNFPPPPAIFVSPKLENHKDSAPSKRRILAGATINGGEKSDICNSVGRSSTFLSDVEKNFVPCRQATHGHQQLAATAGDHSMTPSGAALNSEAIHVFEDGSSRPATKGSQGSSGENAASKLEYLNILPDGRRSAWDSKCLISQEPLAAHVKEASGQGSAGIFHGNHVKMLDQCAQTLPRQSISDKNKVPLSLSSNELEKMAATWSLPVEYLSKMLASLHGTGDIVDHSASVDTDLPQASNEPSHLQSSEEVKAESMDHGCKAFASGVPRRCLDFETLETQQVSPDNLPTLKMMDLSSDNPSCSAFSSRMEANNKDTGLSDNNAWDSGMPTFSTVHGLPLFTRLLNLPSAPYLPPQQNTSINSQVLGPGLSSQMKPICRGLLDTGSAYSLPSMTHRRIENEQNLVQSRDYTRPEYCSNFDQELLLSLVRRTRMLQHDLLLANNAAHTQVAMPTPFYPSVGVGLNPMEETNFSSEMESGPTSFMDKSGAPRQEASHQSESDHQEDSTLSPQSPRKKRRLLTQTGDSTGEGCKNCKCKKSKCLKLYCECFAAGVYCIDICNCHDCYNKPEFEETVLGTRQQIESRNPLAFLPKIIRASDASPTLGEEINDTPASARHKRGCNCKKSQCLKKYCECYQAGVGCADGCRCEGCKNIYGRNEGTGELEDKDQQNATSDMKITTIDESNELDLKHSNDLQSRDLCPITPYLENSGQCRSDGDFDSAERVMSPLEHPTSTMSLQSPSRLLELLEETENFGQLNLQTYQTATTNIVPNRPFSPGWDGQTEMFTPTPPMQPLQRLPPEMSDGLLFNKRNACHPLWQAQNNMGSYMSSLTNPDTAQSSLVQPMLPLSFTPDTTQFETPENALAVPVTPLPSTAYASRPNYDYEEVSESRLSQSVWTADEDDSPNVLRELNTFCAPNIITKSRSPQQKRIFSYQRSAGLRNNLSPGLGSRNGRKFILHALPSSSFSETPRENE